LSGAALIVRDVLPVRGFLSDDSVAVAVQVLSRSLAHHVVLRLSDRQLPQSEALRSLARIGVGAVGRQETLLGLDDVAAGACRAVPASSAGSGRALSDAGIPADRHGRTFTQHS
jgi:hypothetical protein